MIELTEALKTVQVNDGDVVIVKVGPASTKVNDIIDQLKGAFGDKKDIRLLVTTDPDFDLTAVGDGYLHSLGLIKIAPPPLPPSVPRENLQ